MPENDGCGGCGTVTLQYLTEISSDMTFDYARRLLLISEIIPVCGEIRS
jgi:hypothetical protein